MNGSIGIQPVSTRFGSSQNGPHDHRDEAVAVASDSAAPTAPEEPPDQPAPPPPGLGKIVDVTI